MPPEPLHCVTAVPFVEYTLRTLTAANQLFRFSFAAIFRIISSESQYFGGTSVSKISDKEQPSS